MTDFIGHFPDFSRISQRNAALYALGASRGRCGPVRSTPHLVAKRGIFMRKLILGAILASTALASPALARDDSWYVEIDGGVVFVDDMHFVLPSDSTVFQRAAGAEVADVRTKTGYDIGTMVGYDFGSFRLEGEVSYRRAEVQQINSNLGRTGVQPVTFPFGKVSSFSGMLNGFVETGDDDGLQLFVGGGVGYGRVKVQATGRTSPNHLITIDDKDDGFAWQLLAGARVPVSDHIDLGLKYRFHNQANVDVPLHLTYSGGTAPVTTTDTVRTRWRSHSVLATLTYNLRGPAAMPPPPPVVPMAAPTPPPAPVEPTPVAPPVCEKGPYIVFFDWDKSDITPEAASILDSAAAAYGNCANVPVMLAGYADRSGKPTYNQGLSERRNAAVTAYLTGRGVPAGAISSQGFGETNNRVPTADGVRELQNRRVEVSYGPGSGM
jgi:OOP family OmpA-OmpF porin